MCQDVIYLVVVWYFSDQVSISFLNFIQTNFMMTKEKLKEHIDKFPDKEFSIDELIERLIFIEKLEERISISKNSGSTISEMELKNEIEKWSK